MRKGRKKDLRKFDVYEIVIRILTAMLSIAVAAVVSISLLYAPELGNFTGQEINKRIIKMFGEQ